MDMRRNRRMQDGRNPYGSRGGYVSSRRPRRSRRGDRGMDYTEYDMRRDYRGGDYAQNQMSYSDMRGDYRGNVMGYMARKNDYGYDGHYGMQGGRQSGYEPIEFMGYCSGYAGSPEDYARGGRGRQDYGYDMRGGRGRDYGYPMYEHDYADDYGDYGETLTEEDLEHWNKKLMGELDDREKQMFNKDSIMQKAKSMGKKMEGFGEKELYTATLMCYTDYKGTIGQNPDLAIKLAYDWLSDKDVAVKGAEKLAVYFDCIVEGE